MHRTFRIERATREINKRIEKTKKPETLLNQLPEWVNHAAKKHNLKASTLELIINLPEHIETLKMP